MKVDRNARTWCEISLPALRNNLRTLRRRLPTKNKILAVVKDNAYGHGLIPVGRTLAQAGCEEFGVACVSEGVQLRKAGIRQPILLLGSTLPFEFKTALQHQLTITLSSLTEAKELLRASLRSRKTARVQAKLETGMNRLGATPAEFTQLLFFIAQHPSLDLVGTFTHLACADSSLAFTQRQLVRSSRLPKSLPHHWSNTAAVLQSLSLSSTHARPGLGLYGYSPLGRPTPHLQPVLSWKSRILLVRTVTRGQSISYGATFRAPRNMRVATVATGYAHGLPRSLSSCGHALVQGRLCPILGRVTMDMTLLDVSRVPHPRREQEVVWIGRSGSLTRTAADLAREAGTIPWEILTRIHPSLPRLLP